MKSITYHLTQFVGRPIDFRLTLSRKITVITGLAAIGKTLLYDYLVEAKAMTKDLPRIQAIMDQQDLEITSTDKCVYFIDCDNFEINDIKQFIKVTLNAPVRYVLAVRDADTSLFEEFDSVKFVQPIHTRFTYHFREVMWYTNPPVSELKFEDAVCLTEDLGTGDYAFKKAFPAVISSAGSSRLGETLDSIAFISSKTIVVVADEDTWAYIKQSLDKLKLEINVYVILHSSTERMLLETSPLLKNASDLSLSDIFEDIAQIYSSKDITSERLDAVLLQHALTNAGFQVNKDKSLKSHSTLKLDKLCISGAAIREYIVRNLMRDTDTFKVQEDILDSHDTPDLSVDNMSDSQNNSDLSTDNVSDSQDVLDLSANVEDALNLQDNPDLNADDPNPKQSSVYDEVYEPRDHLFSSLEPQDLDNE